MEIGKIINLSMLIGVVILFLITITSFIYYIKTNKRSFMGKWVLIGFSFGLWRDNTTDFFRRKRIYIGGKLWTPFVLIFTKYPKWEAPKTWRLGQFNDGNSLFWEEGRKLK